jgi:hypothetical protein
LVLSVAGAVVTEVLSPAKCDAPAHSDAIYTFPLLSGALDDPWHVPSPLKQTGTAIL